MGNIYCAHNSEKSKNGGRISQLAKYMERKGVGCNEELWIRQHCATIHANLDIVVILYGYFHGIDKVCTFVIGQNCLGRELALVGYP
jgi:hypothetical protein